MAVPLAASIWVFITSIIVPLLLKILIALGIGFAVFSGADLGIDAVSTYVQNQFAGVPAYALQLVAILQVDTYIAILLAAYAARFALQAVNGTLTRLTLGNAGNSVGL